MKKEQDKTDLEEYLHEFACDIDGNLPIIQNIKDQALYKLKIVNMSRDWETGYVDEFDLEFVELKPIQIDARPEPPERDSYEYSIRRKDNDFYL